MAKVTNQDLIEEIKLSKESGEITETLGKMFVFIANYVIGGDGRYKSLTYNEDMKAHAICNMCKSYVKFNTTKSDNPFGYLVTVARCSAANYISKEYKEQHEDYDDGNMANRSNN